MFANKYRTGNAVNFNTSFQTYIINNFNTNTYDSLLPFIREFNQMRDCTTSLTVPTTSDQVTKQIQCLVSYLHWLNEFAIIVPLGKTKETMSLTFTWKEATTGKVTSSTSIHYEICSIKYNLAIAFCIKADIHTKTKDIQEIKNSVKSYQKAAKLFKDIKTIYDTHLKMESIPDFSGSYIEMNMNYCLGMAYVNILKICDHLKDFPKDSRTMLTKATWVYFEKAANVTLSIALDQTYYSYLRDLYKSLTYYNLYQAKLLEVESKGKGMGLMITVLNYAKESFTKTDSHKSKLHLMMDSDLVSNSILQIDAQLAVCQKKNDEFYHEFIPSYDDIPEIKPDFSRAEPIPYNELPSGNNEVLGLLGYLFPKEYQNIKESIVKTLDQFIKEKCAKYSNEGTINQFLSQRNLPQILDGTITPIPFTNQMWEDFQAIQSQGGFGYLQSELAKIDSKAFTLQNKLETVQNILYADTAEDNKYQLLYGDKWKIISNTEYGNTIMDIRNKLGMAKDLYNRIKSQIIDNTASYALLSLPRNQIESQMPKSSNSNDLIASISDTQLLRNAINELSKHKEKLMEIYRNIDKIVRAPIAIDELKKMKTDYDAEKANVEEKKKSLDKYINDIEALDKQIKVTLNQLEQSYQSFLSKLKTIQQNKNSYPSSNNPVNFLLNIKNNYEQTKIALSNEHSTYDDIEKKIRRLDDDVEGFIFAKNMDKQEKIEQLESAMKKLMSQNASKK